jgi:hypothetical protein
LSARTGILAGETRALRRLRGDEDDDDAPGEHVREPKHDSDADLDEDSTASEPKTFYDGDDAAVRGYGVAASAVDRSAIAALVSRFARAAETANGGAACPLLYSVLAEAVPEDYGRGAGPAYSRGNSCRVVMTKLFRHERRELAGGLTLAAARVSRNQARAVVGSRAMPAGYLPLRREHGTWKIDSIAPLALR